MAPFTLRTMSFESRLAQYGGIGPGFDILRVALALAIFYGHALWVAGGNHPGLPQPVVATVAAVGGPGGGWEGPKRPLHVVLVPMFFALSGFLVVGSAFRLRDVRTFLAFRVLRLAPALLIEVTLSAVVLGAAFTTWPVGDYFSSPGFFRYFGNAVGLVTFRLPGVFVDNPVAGLVNVNLWTLPSEFDCYAVASLLLATGLLFRRLAMTAFFAAATLILGGLNSVTNFAVTSTTAAPHVITYYFVLGVMFYLWKHRIPFSLPLFVVSAFAAYPLLWLHHTVYLAAPFVTYCTIYLGLVAFPKIKLISSGDYSYGIYLYGFPISQAVVHLFPAIWGHGWLNVIVALSLTFLFAAGSWHLIEKPALRFKRHLPKGFFPLHAKVSESPTEVVSIETVRPGSAQTG